MDASTRPNTPACPHPSTFAHAMRDHWHALGNVSSPALMKLWTLMGETFNKAIMGNPGGTWNPFGERGGLWHVLSPACGAGKTQGVRVYSAMLARANDLLPAENKVGVLIVTREIEEADKLAEEINTTFKEMIESDGEKRTTEPLYREGGLVEPRWSVSSGQKIALARHSESPKTITLGDIHSATILIITHAAYVQALDRLQQDVRDRWSSIIEWEYGQRRFVVVDETVGNLVENYQLELDSLERTLGNIPHVVRDRHPGQIKRLRSVVMALEWVRSLARGLKVDQEEDDEDGLSSPNTADRAVWDANSRRSPELAAMWNAAAHINDMSLLRQDIAQHRRSDEARLIERKGNLSEHRSMSAEIDRNLKSVQAICSRWAWYSKKGRFNTLNSSRLLLPEPFPVNVVVFDATARQEVLWELLGRDRVVRPEAPRDVRGYANVTLRVARVAGGGLGKTTMIKKGKARLARLVEHLNARFAGQVDRKVFLVCHKDIEHHAKGHVLTFGKLSVAHWGALDGKNAWGDHDTAVIVGLSYRSRIWANNLFQAINGRQDTAWLQSNADLRNKLEIRQLTTSLVQAVNRIRCRRVIDDKGNCPTSEVFLFLRDSPEGDAILSGLREEMPGVMVEPWEHSLDGARATIRKGSSHEDLITFMENAPAEGEWTMGWIEHELSLTERSARDLRETLRNHKSALAQRLADLGVRYETRGIGRGARSFLVKRVKAVTLKAA